MSAAKAIGTALVAAWLAVACGVPPSVPLRPAPADPGSFSRMIHGTGAFRGAGGVMLFEQWWRPKGATRAVLVVHHGLKDHSTRYGELAARLVARGFAVHAYDMRGHGRSSGPRATLGDFSDTLEDLDRFIARVRRREPGRPIFLLGHSVGGAIAALYTLERRPDLAGLILMAPAIRVDRSPLEAAATPIAAALLPGFPAVDTPDEKFSRSPEVVREMGRDPFIHHAKGPARTAGALVAAIERIWRAADTLDVPLLAQHGTADKLTDPRGSAELVRRARTADRTLLLYRGLLHDLIHEPERDQVMTDLERWLDRHVSATGGPPPRAGRGAARSEAAGSRWCRASSR